MHYRVKQNLAFVYIALSALIGLSTAPKAIAASQNVVIAADPWCPFVCDTGGPQQGIMVDIAKEALALTGYKLSYQNINWARAKKMVRAGAVDGIVGTGNYGPEQTPYHFPKTALGIAETCFFRAVNSDWEYTSPISLDTQTMRWINDYMYGDHIELSDWVDTHKKTPQIVVVSGEDTHMRLFKLLLANRITTFAEDHYVINYELNQQDLQDQIEVASCLKPVEKVYVAFSQKTDRGKELAAALDKGVAMLRKNGRLADILENYGLTIDTWVPE